MALRYGYFDSEIVGYDSEGMPILDRAESSDLLCLFFAMIVSDGVLAAPSNCFFVRAAGNGLSLELDPGFGMVKGHFCYNDEVDYLTIEAAPQQYNRIDRVVMRCNYLQRMVEIIIKTGEEATNPVPPALIRPAAGDYFELCLANIKLTAGQKVITQSSITDTRADSSVCGFITNLINRIDTAVFFAQLNKFYDEFVEKSNISYEQFVDMAQNAYNNLSKMMNECYTELSQKGEALYNQYSSEIADYTESLQEQGNSTLTAITQQLIDFRDEKEAEHLAWVERMKDILRDETVGELLLKIAGLEDQINEMEEMLLSGSVMAQLLTDEDKYLTDDMGKVILMDRPICKCS